MASKQLPRLCVITVTKNCDERIAETLESIACQRDAHWRIVVIDGASTDKTCSLVRERLRREDHLLSEPDSGIYDAMNRGIECTREDEYCIFINAGDRLSSSDTLSRIADRIADFPADIHLFSWSTENGARLPTIESIFNLPACHQAIVYRAGTLRSQPFDLTYRYCADFEQYLSLLAKGATVRAHPDISISHFDGGGLTSRHVFRVLREQYLINVRHHGLVLATLWLGRKVSRLMAARLGRRAPRHTTA